MLSRITKTPVAALIFLCVGFAVFHTGLSNPFQGDDIYQIVNNPPVHSISNFWKFFHGGTFYYGQSSLSGGYYRPLVTVVYSILYTLFKLNTFYYHLLQLLIYIGSTVLVYSFLQYSMNARLAFFLSLVFMLHPTNSEVVFSIPSMQDAMYFFFGILALWLLLRFRSTPSLLLVAACLTLSLLTKESGVLFVAMALVYLVWWNRPRLWAFLGIMALLFTAYMSLRLHAVGLDTNPNNAPIDTLSLGGRLSNAPSIGFFYLAEIVWPVPLSTGYYWVHPNFTFHYFLLPLLVDMAFVALVVLAGRAVGRKGTTAQRRTFWFFAAWFAIGIGAHLQFIPLDVTASDTYLYFPMVGLIGMIGVGVSALLPSINSLSIRSKRIDPRLLAVAGVVLLVLYGVRTSIRGSDYNSVYKLAQSDLASSPDDYNAEISIAYHLAQQGDRAGATAHAQRAVAIYPTLLTYNALGLVLMNNGQYEQAKQAFDKALAEQPIYFVYDNLGALTIWYGDPASNKRFLTGALARFPQDGSLWLYLAILEQRNGNNAAARIAIANANTLGSATPYYYDRIMSNAPLTLPSHPTFVSP
jgi:protein O-mannosyl-transferase